MRLDGYESALLGSRALAPHVVPQSDIELYAAGGLYGRVVDMPADAAVARGVTIEGDTDKVIANEMDRLKVLPALADGIRWARLTGGAAILLVVDDGKTLRDPLNVPGIRQIEELKVFDLDDISATDDRYIDPTKSNFGMPERYRVRVTASGAAQAEFTVHESRLIPISGDPLPRRMAAIKGVPWAGRNAVRRAYQVINQYRQSLRWSLSILERKQQGIYGMKGLAELIQADMEGVVQKRIALVDGVRNVRNTVAVDGEDDYRIEDTNVSGVRDVVAEFQIALSAETGIPVTLLFGRSPAGMNSTGEADFDGFYDMVENLQLNRAKPALERLVSLILAQKTVQKKVDQWSIVWPPLQSPTDKEQAEVRKLNAEAEKAEADALGGLIDRGVISEEEGKDHLVAEGRYGLEPTQGSRTAATQYAAQTA